MDSHSEHKIWRGDADFYRRHLRAALSYEALLEMTAHSYVMALEANPLLSLKNYGSYLSTVFSSVSLEQAQDDLAAVIGAWIDDGTVVLTEELQLLCDQGIVTPLPDPLGMHFSWSQL